MLEFGWKVGEMNVGNGVGRRWKLVAVAPRKYSNQCSAEARACKLKYALYCWTCGFLGHVKETGNCYVVIFLGAR